MIRIGITDHREQSTFRRVIPVKGGSEIPSPQQPLPAGDAEVAFQLLTAPVTFEAGSFQQRMNLLPEKNRAFLSGKIPASEYPG